MPQRGAVSRGAHKVVKRLNTAAENGRAFMRAIFLPKKLLPLAAPQKVIIDPFRVQDVESAHMMDTG